MAVSTNVIKNADGTYSIGGVTVREDNGQLQRKWPWGWQKEDNPQIINNWNMYKSSAAPETPTTTSSNAPTQAAYSDGAMQARGFTKNADGNWEKDGVEYDSNGQPIKKAVQAQGLFSGDLRSYLNRKNWVQLHQDYLREKGANIDWANYRGAAELNLALKRLLGGYDAWNLEKERRLSASMAKLEAPALGVGYTNATISGGNEPDRGAILRTPSVNIKVGDKSSYLPATYTEQGTGKIYSFTPLKSNTTPEKVIAGKTPNTTLNALYPGIVHSISLRLKKWYDPSYKTGGKINYQKIFK